jgi:hypothetical protein
MFTRCSLHCPVCRAEFDWHHAYGRDIPCCSKKCRDEAEWRRALSIMGEEYREKIRAVGLMLYQ